MLILGLRKKLRNVTATIAATISSVATSLNLGRDNRSQRATSSPSVSSGVSGIRENISTFRRAVTKQTNNAKSKHSVAMGRRRKGRSGKTSAEETTMRRRFPATTLLSLFIASMIVTTLVAPTVLTHRRKLHELVYFLVHRSDNLDQKHQIPKSSSLTGPPVLHTAARILKAANASSLISQSDVRLISHVRSPMNKINKNNSIGNNVPRNVQVKKKISKSTQRAVVQVSRGNRKLKTSTAQNYRHGEARARRKGWWSLLHRRTHSQYYDARAGSDDKPDLDNQASIKSPSRLGRRNVVRDHIGRIVESGSDSGAASDIGDKRTGLDTSYKSPISRSGMTVEQSNETNTNGKGDNGDGEDKEAEEVEEERDSYNSTDASVKKNYVVDQNEFTGSLGGTEDGMVRGQNVTKLSVTLFKIMKLFGFSSLTDSPAGAHAEWMGDVARRLSFEQPLFRYVGVDETPDELGKARESVGDSVDGEYELHDVERELGNATDVLFHWAEMDGSPRDAHHPGYLMHVRKVLRAAQRAGHGHVIFPQLPRLQGVTPSYRHGKWTFMDHKDEEPFLFNDHVRGAVPVGNGSRTDVIYLTFYSTRAIPAAHLDV